MIIAQNGIEVLQDATAEVKHNFVSSHIFTPQTVSPAGVLLALAGSVDLNHNTVVRNDVDVFTEFSSAPSSLTHNRTRASTFDGIVVVLANNVTVGENLTEQNGGPGIGLYDGATANVLSGNQVEHNSNNFSNSTTCPGCFGGGILLDNANNNAVSGNHVRNNGTANTPENTDGIRVNLPSMGNSIQSNHLRSNVTHDCHDATAPGDNTWADNHGETSFPMGLCSDDSNDDFAERLAGTRASRGTASTMGWPPTTTGRVSIRQSTLRSKTCWTCCPRSAWGASVRRVLSSTPFARRDRGGQQ